MGQKVGKADIDPFVTRIPVPNGSQNVWTKHICRAYQMMSWFNGGQEVSTDADKEPIWTLATVKDKQIKVLCYSFEADPRVEYTTAVDLTVRPAGIGARFKATKYELSSTKANSWYLAQEAGLTQADCENDISLVDKINRESELKPENAGTYQATNDKIHLNFSLPAYSAVLYVFEAIN